MLKRDIPFEWGYSAKETQRQAPSRPTSDNVKPTLRTSWKRAFINSISVTIEYIEYLERKVFPKTLK